MKNNSFSKSKNLILLIFLLHFSNLYSQNKFDFLKYQPSKTEIEKLPDWAKHMYSEDPNVYDVMDQYSAFYAQNDFVKSIHTQNYKYWVRKVYANLDKKGHIRMPSVAEQKASILQKQKKAKSQNNTKNASTSWTNIGPFETYFRNSTLPVSWQCNVYAIDQSTSNPDLLICGTEHGGVFKTINKGDSWTLASANASFCNSVSAVAIDPSNNNIFYAGAAGILYKTTDGGTTWNTILFLGGTIHEIKFDPTNASHIFVISNAGLDESLDAGANWNKIFTDKSFDLDYHPTNPNYVYLLKENTTLKKAEFYRSTNNGTTWNLMSTGWYVPEIIGEANVGGGKIGISPNDPNRVYAALIGESKLGDDGWIGVYRSNDSGSSWTLPAGQIGSPYSGTCNTGIWNVAAYCGSTYHQGFYNFDFEVSPNNADLFWIGTIRLAESNDGGATFSAIGSSGSLRLNDIHADIQSIHIQGNDIWVASDGGINYSNDNLQTHTSKKYGISASSYWGFDIGWNEDVIVGGRYHNGNAVLYDTYGLGNSHHLGGVEEPAGHVHPMDNQKVFFGCCYGNDVGSSNTTDQMLIPPTLGSPSTNFPNINFRNNEFYIPHTTSEFTHHPNYSNHILAGRLAAIWQSKDGGQTWNILHDFVDGYVTEIEYCRSNPNQIYCINRLSSSYGSDSQLYQSTDGGTTWNPINSPPTDDAFRFTIATNPFNENEIWAAAPFGGNNAKVYRSTNGGNTWTNMTTSALDNERIFDMEFHGGSNGTVYLLTRDKYFYYDVANSQWVQYNTGLPFNLSDNEIKFTKLFYRDSKIRLGSSRGVWEVDFPIEHPPVAEPMTYTDYVNCEQDLVQLESYSMVNHAGATWAWSISPAPQYISNPSARNPQVVFGAPGFYDVSLTVTDANGQSHSKTVTNMFEVDSNCECAPCPTCNVTYYTNGDAVMDFSNCCVDLAENTTWSVGSVWYEQKINLNQSFIMNFDLNLGDISGNEVDGVAMVLQNQSYNALGGAGSELGRNGIFNSIAIAFRTYVHDRIEIWVNGEGHGNDVSGNPYPISGMGSFPVKIAWDAYNNSLTIDWNNDGDDIIFNNDIINNYFGGNPNNIIWGFTGATGGLAGTNRVCNIEIAIDDCPPSYSTINNNKLTGIQNTNTHFETNGIIESDETISTGKIIKYDAAIEINMEAGFEVILGAVFEAFIDGCDN